MYASYVLEYDNKTIEDRSRNNLPGFIEHCCRKIEESEPEVFVKYVRVARTDAIKKIDLLQKSIHYYDVSISNEIIQSMLANFNLYFEHILSKLVRIVQHANNNSHT